MSYFPNFLELQRSNNWTEKNECQMPRNTMNELIMNYLVTGIFFFISQIFTTPLLSLASNLNNMY